MIRRSSSAAAALLAACLPALAPAPPVGAQTVGAPAVGAPGAPVRAPGPTEREAPVALVADEIRYDSATGRVTASGNVEVFYGERTLSAERIVYDSRADRIAATGNIVLRDPSGATVYADLADLDAELRDGLVRGARSVLGERTRLSAVEARRVEDRFNTLAKAVYSPCDVCEEDPTPLWRIRARRVIHDERERVIHYENATFDVFGVPVAWLPYFRHPDPTVERASGFLVPSFSQSTNYGFGLKVPYHVVLDAHSDLTLSPFIMTGETPIGELEYRRAFEDGTLRFAGSATRTNYTGESRFQGHVDSEGLFRADWLEAGARWGWRIQAASDDAYLRRFDFSEADLLTSEAFVRNYGRDGFYDLTGVAFQSLRDNDPDSRIPRVLPEFAARHAWDEAIAGGEIGVFANTQTLFREEGTDVSRVSIGADWEREAVLPVGLALRAFAELRGDLFVVTDEPLFGDDTTARFAPLAGVEARFPLIHEDAGGGVSHVVQPIAQLILAPYGGNGARFPNEDSQQTEFDETNLFERTRFSGLDAVEEGPRVNLGMRYERVVRDGLRLDGTLGRVFRFADADEFGSGTGLSGTASDWVGAWALEYDPYVRIRQRMRVGDDLSISRNEVFADAFAGPVSLSLGYAFLEADPASGTRDDREEVSGRLGLRLANEWRVSGFAQRDLEAQEFVGIGGLVSYQNECCAIDLFVNRRFTDSRNAPSSTSVGVQIRLLTLGTEQTLREVSGAGPFTTSGQSGISAGAG